MIRLLLLPAPMMSDPSSMTPTFISSVTLIILVLLFSSYYLSAAATAADNFHVAQAI